MLPCLVRLLAASALLVGCAAPRSTTSTTSVDEERLRPVGDVAEDFVCRLSIAVTRSVDGPRTFEASLVKDGDLLTLVGQRADGGATFVVVQRGAQVELSDAIDGEPPLPARRLVSDLQRMFWPMLPGEPPTDGVREGVLDCERVVETWRDRELCERRFARTDGASTDGVRIVYRWPRDGLLPESAVLQHDPSGQRVEVKVLADTELSPFRYFRF